MHDSRKIRPCLLAAGRTKKPPSSGLSKTDYHRVAISPNVLGLRTGPIDTFSCPAYFDIPPTVTDSPRFSGRLGRRPI